MIIIYKYLPAFSCLITIVKYAFMVKLVFKNSNISVFVQKVILFFSKSLLTNILDSIQDLNHWVTGWVDWNLALDEVGGPNWSGNFVDAPIIVNETADEFYKQPMYYAMGMYQRLLQS